MKEKPPKMYPEADGHMSSLVADAVILVGAREFWTEEGHVPKQAFLNYWEEMIKVFVKHSKGEDIEKDLPDMVPFLDAARGNKTMNELEAMAEHARSYNGWMEKAHHAITFTLGDIMSDLQQSEYMVDLDKHLATIRLMERFWKSLVSRDAKAAHKIIVPLLDSVDVLKTKEGESERDYDQVMCFV